MLLVRTLETGGAERQLVTLAAGLLSKGHRVMVAVFYESGSFRKDLRDLGIAVYELGKSGRWDFRRFFVRLLTMVKREHPEIIYAFHTTPNVFALLLKVFFPSIPIVLGIRASNMDMAQYELWARLTDSMVHRLGRLADLVVVNSRAGAAYAIRHGLPKRRMLVVQNGIDAKVFYPDPEGGSMLRAKWGVGQGEKLIGIVGRFDPQKGYPVFLRAATLLAEDNPFLRFVVIGDGPDRFFAEFRELSVELGIEDKVVWAGKHSDMTSVYGALDVLCSSSIYGEGFSNAVGEAMACGVPCVVTAVGDSAEIVGRLGEVCRPGDSGHMKEAVARLLTRSKLDPSLGGKCRSRIEMLYGSEKMVDATEAAFRNLLLSSEKTPNSTSL